MWVLPGHFINYLASETTQENTGESKYKYIKTNMHVFVVDLLQSLCQKMFKFISNRLKRLAAEVLIAMAFKEQCSTKQPIVFS